MNECICCRDRLIKHLNHRKMYWFCPTCHQEMPNPEVIRAHHINQVKSKFFPSLVVNR